MIDTSLFIAKPGTLSAADKKELRKAGIVVIEAADPADFRFIRAEAEVSGSDMLFAAMEALQNADGIQTARQMFTFNIAKLVKAQHAKKVSP